jgi:tetratricopeptide (TPR) repeat protein
MTDRERFGTRGLYYRMIGDNQQCAKEYSEMLALYPADTVGHIQRASCLNQLKQMREAVESARQAVQMLPNHMGYRTNLALLTAFAGDFEAVENEVNSIPQPTPVALLALAYSQMGRGLLPQATATYEKMASMGPLGASISTTGLADIASQRERGRHPPWVPPGPDRTRANTLRPNHLEPCGQTNDCDPPDSRSERPLKVTCPDPDCR